MSVTPSRPAAAPPKRAATAFVPPSAWIRGRWSDLALFIATPLLIVPIVGLARMRLSIEQVAIYVTAFGAMGHHLPGMLRAYGDRELFRRFRTRFLLAPVVLLGVALWFTFYELDGLILVAVMWATWHAWMQVYGFLRIYESKSGSSDARTARLDLLMCAGWFISGVLFSPTRLGQLLSDFYKCGGPYLAPGLVHAAQWIAALLTAVTTAAFIANTLNLARRGHSPSRLKLLLLVSSVGFWWYCMIAVNNAILGVALFEIFHDVQYLAIVWQFNRRRAEGAPTAGGFTRFLFRGGGVMLGLYLGLVFAYGALGLLPRIIDADAVNRVLGALFVTSGLLHFYYDGFIWKVRERATREGLGLATAAASEPWSLPRGAVHVLKWLPFAAVVGWFGWAQAHGVPPETERLEHVVAAVPDAWQSQLMLAADYLNAGDTVRALPPLQAAARCAPHNAQVQSRLGNALARMGRDDDAALALTRATELDPHLPDAHVDLAVILARRDLTHSAEEHYRQALADDPEHVQALNNLGALLNARGALDDAATCFQSSSRLDPRNAEPVANLGIVRLRQRRLDEALALLQQALLLDSENVGAHLHLGVVFAQQGRLDLANDEYRAVLQRQPDSLPALNSLAWNLATMPEPPDGAADAAVTAAERAAGITSRRDLSVLQILAAAYAAAGRFDEAVAVAEHVLSEAQLLKSAALAAQMSEQLTRYRAGQSLRQ
ncbi:MAG: tetratricopeptide repeat protein [Planctomycetaceae bacterium]|nr:tetratricopeptide repeat protein [Planctomycetaceae bacterium]